MGEKASGDFWQLEVSDPYKKINWQPIWMFDKDQFSTYQELADMLNQINAPIRVRIVRHAD